MNAARSSSASSSSATHRTVQRSTTLNRKFVKKPSSTRIVKKGEQLKSASERRAELAAELNRKHLLAIKQKSTPAEPKSSSQTSIPVTVKSKQKPAPAHKPKETPAPQPHPAAAAAKARLASAHSVPRQLTAAELKDRAIQRALVEASHLDSGQTTVVEQQMTEVITPKKHFWRRKKLILTLSLSVVSVAFLGFLVWRNLPDIINHVSALGSGIEIDAPGYIPAGYRQDSIISEKSGKITMSFVGRKGDFTITKEKSPWNTSALLTNFVEPEWGTNYSTAHEQGLTIYISGSNAAWVNGGIFYRIEDPTGVLRISDLHDIAISL